MSATPGTLIVSQASVGATSLPAIAAGLVDGKLIKLTIAGIAGATLVKLYINSSEILYFGENIGNTFYTEVWLTWNSTNKDVSASSPIAGTAVSLTSFNPSTFTFSTDSVHTITSFTAILL